MRDWLKDRQGDGELVGMVLACSLLEGKGSAGLAGEDGSEQECSQPPWDWSPINKNLFPSTLIVGSGVKAPHGQALVCSVTESLPNFPPILQLLLRFEEHLNCLMPTHPHLGILPVPSFADLHIHFTFWSSFYRPRTVLGSGNTVVNKTHLQFLGILYSRRKDR